MNIYPSDTDVRQGLTPVNGTTAPLPGKGAQASQNQANSQAAASLVDEHSRKVAATADKTQALFTAQQLAEKLDSSGSTLKIRLLEGNSAEVQVEIVDRTSNKVLRKIPQDEILKLSASIKKMSGLALDQPA